MPDARPTSAATASHWYSPRGRAGRLEYWAWLLGTIPLCLAAAFLLCLGGVVGGIVYHLNEAAYIPVMVALYTVLVLGAALSPFFLMLARRLRDAGLKPSWSWQVLLSLMLNLALYIYLGFPIMVQSLSAAKPIIETIDREKERVHLEYVNDAPARQEALTRLQVREQNELLQMYHNIADPVWKDNQEALFCLDVLTRCNGVFLLLLLVPGFLPSRKNSAEHIPDPES